VEEEVDRVGDDHVVVDAQVEARDVHGDAQAGEDRRHFPTPFFQNTFF